jgi:hypothetical protein
VRGGRFSAVSSGMVNSSFWVKAVVRRGELLISIPPLGLFGRDSHWRPRTEGFPEAGLHYPPVRTGFTRCGALRVHVVIW